MSDNALDALREIFDQTVAAHRHFAAERLDRVAAAAEAIAGALDAGHKVLAFGNGGSASDAEHFVAELVGRFECERQPFNAIALTGNSSLSTAIANDYGYDQIFVRQLEGLGCAGDVVLGISTSGQSRNVAAALATAKRRGLTTIALTGRDGGVVGAEADVHINVPESSTPRIQEVHRTVAHAICSLIDRILKRS